MVARVDADLRSLAQLDAVGIRGTPVRHIHRVERRLEELVLQDQPLLTGQPLVDGFERLGEPVLPGRDAVLPGVVGPVGEPQLEVPGAGLVHHVDTRQEMVERFSPDARIGVRHTPQHVVVVLEDVSVDRPEPDPGVGGRLTELLVAVDGVPRDVQGDAGGHTGVGVHLGGIRDLLERRTWDALLGEHLEAGARVAERPGGQLDPLATQGCLRRLTVDHGSLLISCCSWWRATSVRSSSSRSAQARSSGTT